MSLNGGNLHSDRFLKKMGAAGLHPFVDGLRSQGISKMSELQAKPVQEIRKIGKTINMPDAAVDRLLETLGKIDKKEYGNTFKKVSKKTVKKTEVKNGGAKTAKSKAKPATAPASTEPTATSKVQESSYYHFSSTPAEQARKFDAKVVSDPNEVKWQTAKGASSWNPGNTVEDRDFSSQAQEMLKDMLKNYQLADNITITNVKKTNGDLTVISSRGKIKCVYDLSFESEWEGEIDGNKVKGKLDIQDIMPDDDDWYIKCTTKKRDEFHNKAKKLVNNNLVENMQKQVFDRILNYYVSKYKS